MKHEKSSQRKKTRSRASVKLSIVALFIASVCIAFYVLTNSALVSERLDYTVETNQVQTNEPYFDATTVDDRKLRISQYYGTVSKAAGGSVVIETVKIQGRKVTVSVRIDKTDALAPGNPGYDLSTTSLAPGIYTVLVRSAVHYRVLPLGVDQVDLRLQNQTATVEVK